MKVDRNLPPTLVGLVPYVTTEAWEKIVARFRRKRHVVIHRLRMHGVSDREICALLGCTPQYLYKSYPRRMGGPKPERKSKS